MYGSGGCCRALVNAVGVICAVIDTDKVKLQSRCSGGVFNDFVFKMRIVAFTRYRSYAVFGLSGIGVGSYYFNIGVPIMPECDNGACTFVVRVVAGTERLFFAVI